MQSVKIDSHWLNITYTKRKQQQDVYFRVYSWAAMNTSTTPPTLFYSKKTTINPSKTLTENLEEAEMLFQLYIRHDQSHSLCFGDPDSYWKDPWLTGEFRWELEMIGVALAKCWEIAREELADVWLEHTEE